MARSKKRSAKMKAAKSADTQKPKVADKTGGQPVSQKRAKLFKRTPTHEKPQRQKLASAPKLFVKSCRLLLDNWKLFAVILVVYALLYILLVGGLTGNNLQSVKSELTSGHASGTSSMTTLFTTLLTSGNSGNTVGGVYQSFLLLIVSLVLIWALRQAVVGNAIRARDAFYKGTYPLVPFLLVLLVIGLQFVPALIGASLYAAVAVNGIASAAWETLSMGAVFAGLAALSFYWVSSSVIALYIATQPDIAPMQALRSAREIVKFRRFEVLRKLLFLPFVLFVLGIVILMPIAMYATPVATIIFFLLTVVALAIVHSYLFTLYRELVYE